MPTILAIDTSNNQCSVALNRDGEIQSAVCLQARQHAKRLMPMIDEIMRENALELKELAAIAFVNGPGSFTGLRIGAGVAQGLAFGSSLPVLPVSTLAVMAQKAHLSLQADYYIVAMHAREDEIYFAIYQNKQGSLSLLGEEQVTAAAQLPIDNAIMQAQCCAVGDGWQQNEQLGKIAAEFALQCFDCEADAKSASQLAMLHLEAGKSCAPQFALPVYLKEQMDY